MKRIKTTFALFTAVALLASSASAGSYYLQAASGHPFLTNLWANYSATTSNTTFLIHDGRGVTLAGTNVSGQGKQGTWVIPIPVDSGNRTWRAQPYSSAAETRICSFTSGGVFYGCGAPVAAGSVSSVFVPSEGSAFTQTTLSAYCQAGGACYQPGDAKLHQVKAYY